MDFVATIDLRDRFIQSKCVLKTHAIGIWLGFGTLCCIQKKKKVRDSIIRPLVFLFTELMVKSLKLVEKTTNLTVAIFSTHQILPSFFLYPRLL